MQRHRRGLPTSRRARPFRFRRARPHSGRRRNDHEQRLERGLAGAERPVQPRRPRLRRRRARAGRAARRVDPSTVRVSVDGTDVTSAFAVRPDGATKASSPASRTARNDLMATMRKGPTVHLTITNHPSGGPVFAGPQVQPWICKTVAGFPAPTDAQCDARDRVLVRLHGRGHAARSSLRPGRAAAGRAIATTTTDQGETVPYIVRLERGAMDRGLYDVAVLANPSAGWAPWASQPRLEPQGALPVRRRHGAVAHERRAAERPRRPRALARVHGREQQPQHPRRRTPTTSSRPRRVMMLKEHIAETYGSIRYTIGAGCSGGSIQQHVIAADYPGPARRHPAELQLPGQLDDRERGERLPPAAALLRHGRAGLHARRSRRP